MCFAIGLLLLVREHRALRSSESTASEAFLKRILQRNEFTMQTARSRTARTTG